MDWNDLWVVISEIRTDSLVHHLTWMTLLKDRNFQIDLSYFILGNNKLKFKQQLLGKE
jgi:hypothetical protein